MLPVPVSSANPFMSPLSCLTALCTAAESSPGGLRGPLQSWGVRPRPCSRLGKALGSWHALKPPPGRGLSHSQERSRHIRTFRRRLTRVIWALLLGSRLGAVAISAGNVGCGGLAESRGERGGGGPRPPGSRWQPLADAKTLRRLPGSRGCRQNACHRCGSTPTAFRSICFSRKTFMGFLSARRPAPSKGLGQLQPPGSAWPAGTARCLCRGCLLCLYDVYSFF